VREEFYAVERGEVELLPPPILCPRPWIQVQRGYPPPLPRRHLSGDLGLPSLFLRPQLLTTSMVCFTSRLVLRQDNPSWCTMSTSEMLRMDMSTLGN
jgi:hypothetical protein